MKQLVILSGKGGTGKTTVAAALAHLASQEVSVVLVDADVDAANLDIDLKDDTLSIVGKVASGPEDGTALLAEYSEGNFFRNFHITDVVDQNKITATVADGVLRLVLPKAEKAVPRRIPISTE